MDIVLQSYFEVNPNDKKMFREFYFEQDEDDFQRKQRKRFAGVWLSFQRFINDAKEFLGDDTPQTFLKKMLRRESIFIDIVEYWETYNGFGEFQPVINALVDLVKAMTIKYKFSPEEYTNIAKDNLNVSSQIVKELINQQHYNEFDTIVKHSNLILDDTDEGITGIITDLLEYCDEKPVHKMYAVSIESSVQSDKYDDFYNSVKTALAYFKQINDTKAETLVLMLLNELLFGADMCIYLDLTCPLNLPPGYYQPRYLSIDMGQQDDMKYIVSYEKLIENIVTKEPTVREPITGKWYDQCHTDIDFISQTPWEIDDPKTMDIIFIQWGMNGIVECYNASDIRRMLTMVDSLVVQWEKKRDSQTTTEQDSQGYGWQPINSSRTSVYMKLWPLNYYVNTKSIVNMLQSTSRRFLAIPDKTCRVGNLIGRFGVGNQHAQLPEERTWSLANNLFENVFSNLKISVQEF